MAEMDLAEITDYIGLDSPQRAERFEEELLERAQRIGRSPLAYVERPELQPGLRSCAHGAYVIFFTVTGDSVRIERILHGARDLGPLLRR
jgi:toxin ParE1/3/4